LEKEILKITSKNGYIASILTIKMSALIDLVLLKFGWFQAVYAFRFAKYLLLAARLGLPWLSLFINVIKS
jgi:hypothetical protein